MIDWYSYSIRFWVKLCDIVKKCVDWNEWMSANHRLFFILSDVIINPRDNFN